MPKNRKSTPRAKTGAPKPKPKLSRRQMLQNVSLYGVGGLVLAGAGYFGITTFRGAMDEQDLTVLGSGQPTIVQVHDPACEVCVALQIEVRAALETLEQRDIGYRVANIDSGPGMAFATEYGAAHATLLFFDGDGNMIRKMQGASDRNTLRAAFMAHLAAEGA